jgi:hypothetical protein
LRIPVLRRRVPVVRRMIRRRMAVGRPGIPIDGFMIIPVGRRMIPGARRRMPVGRRGILRMPVGGRMIAIGRSRIRGGRRAIPVGRRRIPIGGCGIRRRKPIGGRRVVVIVVARHGWPGVFIAKLMIAVGPDKPSWRSRIDLPYSDAVWGPAGLVRFPRVELRLVGQGVCIIAIGGSHTRKEAG